MQDSSWGYLSHSEIPEAVNEEGGNEGQGRGTGGGTPGMDPVVVRWGMGSCGSALGKWELHWLIWGRRDAVKWSGHMPVANCPRPL